MAENAQWAETIVFIYKKAKKIRYFFAYLKVWVHFFSQIEHGDK